MAAGLDRHLSELDASRLQPISRTTSRGRETMLTRLARPAGAMLAAAIACASPGPAGAQTATIVPQPFPPQYVFPVPTATVQGWVNNSNTPAMRDHAWM